MSDGDTDTGFDPDHPHPLTTENGREYLTTEGYYEGEEYASQLRSQAKRQLRERIQGGLEELTWLAEYLPAEEQDRIFEDTDGWSAPLAFFFRPAVREILGTESRSELSGSQATTAGKATEEVFENWFGYVLGLGIESALEAEGVGRYEVDVDIDVRTVDEQSVDSAIETIRSGGNVEDLDHGELLDLLHEAERSGGFDAEATAEAVASARENE